MPCFGLHPNSVGHAFLPDSVRRVSDPAGVPDRRSPALIVGPGIKGICALKAHSKERRPVLRSGARAGSEVATFADLAWEMRYGPCTHEPYRIKGEALGAGTVPPWPSYLLVVQITQGVPDKQLKRIYHQ